MQSTLRRITAITRSTITTITPPHRRAARIMAQLVKSPPLFSFGLISDIQYADADMRWNYSRTEQRHYRHALAATHRAVTHWAATTAIAFVVHCGDIIDGINASGSADESHRALRHVMAVLEGRTYTEADAIIDRHTIDCHPRWPVYHLIGNHELYCNDRLHWLEQFSLSDKAKTHTHHHPSDASSDQDSESADARIECMFPLVNDSEWDRAHQAYYAFDPHPQYTFIFLDSYDISVLSWPATHRHSVIAQSVLDDRNPNENKDSPSGLRGLDRRFVRFNGGIGANQLLWLSSVLEHCQQSNKSVVVFSHIPLHRYSSSALALCWNYEDVLKVLAKYSGCVRACFAGHDHDGRVYEDKALGITFVTVPGVIASEIDQDRFGVVECHEHSAEVSIAGMAPVHIEWSGGPTQ